MARFGGYNKYSAKKTESKLCGKIFDSKAEARRGEELKLLEDAGEIKNLEYQITYPLYQKPSIKIKLDFRYEKDGVVVIEDVKGMIDREARVKLAWLKEKHGIAVRLLRWDRSRGWQDIDMSGHVIE